VCDLLLRERRSAEETERLNTELGNLQDKIDSQELWELDHNVEVAMEALRLPPPDAPVAQLSGGEKRRVALCRLLISNRTSCFSMNPPTIWNAESVAWLETYSVSLPVHWSS